jgi:hypothetical protein
VTLPGLLLLGAPKCGTTTLAAWWDQHSGGFTAPEKEVGFFTAEWDRGLNWYRSRFASAPAGAVTCDASPGYMYEPIALDRIATVLPDARLAVILRDPVARVWSHWCYMVALGLEPRSFDTVLDEESADPSSTPPGFPLGYLRGSRYLQPLSAIAARFEREQLLVLFTDELREDPVGTFGRLCTHGGIPPGQPGSSENAGRWPRSLRLHRWLGQQRAYGWPLGVGRRLMFANLRPGPPPAITPEHRERLQSLLLPDLPDLEAWLEAPLPAAWAQLRR